MLYGVKRRGYSNFCYSAKTDYGTSAQSPTFSKENQKLGLVLNLLFELVAGVKRDNPARLNRYRFAGPGVSTRPGGFGSDLKIAKTGNLDISAFHQTRRNQVEKGVDHVL